MKRWLMLLCLGLSWCAAAQDASNVPVMENAWNHAELHNDAAAVDLLLADDFVMTTAEGVTYNKAQTVASVKDAIYKPGAAAVIGHDCARFGQHCRGDTNLLREGRGHGKTVGAAGGFTDTWVWTNGKWQCLASQFSVKPK